MDPVRRRGLRRRTYAALVVPALLVLFATPALAEPTGDIGDVRSPAPESLPMELLLYIGVPALGFVIAILLTLRTNKGSSRYRPGQPWEHETAWFGSSVEETTEQQESKRKAALPGAGGASGQW